MHRSTMRFSKTAVAAAFSYTLAASSISSNAFTSSSSSIAAQSAFTVGRTTNNFFASSSRVLVSPSITRSTTMTMLFSNLFGGGSYNTKTIDYTALDFPGSELGKFAQEGKVFENSDREPNLKAASFAGGCFWGVELAYQRVPGVAYTAVGYTQGDEENPTYEQVCAGATKHTEALIVYYDPKECSYEKLLDTFFNRVDPTTVMGQGNDRGTQYRTGVYFHSKEQEEIAKKRFENEKGNHSRPLASELKPAKVFWPAEKYHQQYLEKGGRMGMPQDASKGATSTIRCYG